MAIPKESFKLVSPSFAANMYVVDYPLLAAEEGILVPTAADALLLGEWLTPTRTEGYARREDGAGGHLSFPFFSPRGAYDIQVRKIIPLIQHGTFVADTWVFDRATVLTLGQEVTAKLVAFEGANRSILASIVGAELRRGIVLKVAATSTSPIRILGNY